jgi:hypothetical protein
MPRPRLPIILQNLQSHIHDRSSLHYPPIKMALFQFEKPRILVSPFEQARELRDQQIPDNKKIWLGFGLRMISS